MTCVWPINAASGRYYVLPGATELRRRDIQRLDAAGAVEAHPNVARGLAVAVVEDRRLDGEAGPGLENHGRDLDPLGGIAHGRPRQRPSLLRGEEDAPPTRR